MTTALPGANLPSPLSIFISYAHADEADKDRLVSELSILQRKKLVKAWDDRQIDGGDEWRHEIFKAMDGCDLALLLVSRHFLASEFIQSDELTHLLKRRDSHNIRVVSLVLSPCLWMEVEAIGKLQALPKDAKPIKSFPEESGQRDEAWVGIAKKIAGWARKFIEGQDAIAPAGALAHVAPAHVGTPAHMTPAAVHAPALPHADTPIAAHAATHAPNPFDPWQAATGARFFGRSEELQDLQRAMEEGRSLSLIGERRIGKTSLLRTWQGRLEQMHRTVRFLNGQGPESVSCTALLAAIVGAAAMPGAAGAGSAEQIADQCANILASWCQSHAPFAPVLLIDEADPLPQKLPHRFFERLRNLVENRQLCLVFASHEDINEVYQKTGRTSPLINLLETRQLGLLSPDAASAMAGMGQFDFERQSLMRKVAGTHPYYLALLGRRLWDMDDIELALAQFHYEADKRLAELWAHLSAGEQAAVEQVGRGEAVASKKRLNDLKMKGLLDAKGQLFGEVLADWLRERT